MAHFHSPKSDRPQPFGYKQSWWVVSASDPVAVAQVLRLQNCQPCNCAEGIAPEPNVFVSPPVRGWIFIVGELVLWDGDRPFSAKITPILEQLSCVFGTAHYFITHRVVELHVWARAEAGTLVRGYGYLGETGETLWNEGDAAVERELGFAFFDETSPEADRPDYWERKDLRFPDEDCVMQIAQRWCLAPVNLRPESAAPALGVIGQTPSA